MAITTGPNLPEQTQDTPITGDLQAPQSQDAQQPTQPLNLQPGAPAVTVPGAPGPSATSKNPQLHRFATAIIGALAGEGPRTYTTDANGKVVAAPYAPETTGTKLKRIAANAFEGLSAGAQVGPQKSGLAAALAGFGAGANAVGNKMSAEDQAAKKQATDDWEREQQNTLHKMELAKGNALLYSTYKHLHDQDIDKNEEYKVNSDISKAFEDEKFPVRRVTGDQLLKEFNETPQQLLTEGRVLLTGERAMATSDGQAIIDPQTQQPRYERMYAVVDGMHEGKIKAPQSFVDYVQKYVPYATDTRVKTPDSLSEGTEIDAKSFYRLHNAALEGLKNVTQGWAKPEAIETADGKILQRNTVSGETKPATQEQTDAYQKRKLDRQKEEQALKTSKATEDKENVETQLKRKQLTDENSLNPPASAGLTGEAYLKSLPQGQQDVLKAVAEGRETRSPRQLQDKNGNPTPFAEALHRAYPDFDDKKAIAYGAVVKDFTSGPTSRSLTSYGTAINHARALYDNTNMKSYIPGTDEYKRYNQDITYVATEVAKALNPTGVATESAIKEQEEALRSYTNRKAAIENAEHIMTGKMAETKQRWANAQVRPSYQPPMPGLSPEAIANADYVRNHGRTQGPQNGQPSAAPKQNPFRTSQPGQ